MYVRTSFLVLKNHSYLYSTLILMSIHYEMQVEILQIPATKLLGSNHHLTTVALATFVILFTAHTNF